MPKLFTCCILCLCLSAVLSSAADVYPANVAAYQIPAGLAGVRHLDKAPSLSPAQKAALVQNGFVVVPDQVEQMFLLYEDYGDDYEKGPMPNFITVDSILQTYHSLFDKSLRTVETEHLIRICTALTQHCAGESVKQLQAAPEGPVQEAAARNLAYFLVARSFLTGQAPSIGADVPDKAAIIEMAKDELAKAVAHEGRFPSGITGRTVHYDQFSPRGHYTRSEELKKYFMAMMWYGTLGFELDAEQDSEPIAEHHTLQALLFTRILAGSDWVESMWERIYEPTSFFVGSADDLTWGQYLPLARQVYSDGIPLAELADQAKLREFISLARETLPAPEIAPAFLQADEAGNLEEIAAKPQGRQFRFMGQRFIPDSYALQQLVYPLVGGEAQEEQRYWPMGLDVMAVLGSTRARDLLIGTYEQDQYANYSAQLDKVTAQFAGTPEDKWWSNLYWGWLRSLQPLLEEKGEGYPTFMRNDAWLDKELATAQGSWAQLRHDTILYGKPSGAEFGGPDPREVKGYIEPYPEVFGSLKRLAVMSHQGLGQRDLLPEALGETYDAFIDTLGFLETCSAKQLLGTALSKDEYDRIQFFGGELERLALETVDSDTRLAYWHEITSTTDRNMATIADIHTSFGQCLEVGVGMAHRIYVAVPVPEGGLQLAKGGVMSYYEFQWPVSDRLTDEKWIDMLKAGKQPEMPQWTKSFTVE